MRRARVLGLALAVLGSAAPSAAQVAPGAAEWAAYEGLHGAAARGDVAEIARLAAMGAALDARDGHGRTPLMLAAYRRDLLTARALITARASLDALDRDRYDAVTIAAVLDDAPMLRLLVAAGAAPGQVTSPYQGTALIAAAHLGHVEVVRVLIDARAPLDHVNNLGWTALIEAIVLGDGGPRHVATVEALVRGGANPSLPDSAGVTPLALARRRGYLEIERILVAAGARP
jgi:ankyrin repeat protein